MQSFLLKAGYTATITTDALSTASYSVIDDPLNAATAPTSIAASTTVVLGPFTINKRYKIDESGSPATISIVFFNGLLPIIDPIEIYAASGAIAVDAGIKKITKSSAFAALTLAAPTSAQDGMVIKIISTTAKAHTVTATGLFLDGVTGGAKDTATFAAFAGAGMEIMALDGSWIIISLNAVTVA